MLLLIPAWHAL